MKIGIDISPLKSGHYLQHRVRGTGFYLKNLKESLLKYYPENKYLFFNQSDKIPSDIDLIHIPYFEPFFLTLPLIKKYKTVVTVHDLTPIVFKDKFPAGIKGNLRWKIQKQILKKSDFIITDSISSKKDIENIVGVDSNKVDVIHLAAASHFNKHEKKNLNILKKYNLPEKFILYVGDATWNKNLPNIIKAISKTNHFLVIVGSAFVNKDYDKTNPWNLYLNEAQVLASVNKKILPIGFVPDEDLVQIYNFASLFIMPSFYEGFGLPILEAMQSGTPVITSKAGSLEEVADSAAYFVDPNDVGSIQDGINEVMSNSELRKALSKKGIVHAEKFTWSETAKKTNDVYKKVLNG